MGDQGRNPKRTGGETMSDKGKMFDFYKNGRYQSSHECLKDSQFEMWGEQGTLGYTRILSEMKKAVTLTLGEIERAVAKIIDKTHEGFPRSVLIRSSCSLNGCEYRYCFDMDSRTVVGNIAKIELGEVSTVIEMTVEQAISEGLEIVTVEALENFYQKYK